MKNIGVALLVLAFASLLQSCGSSKKAQVTPTTPQPEWVKNRPTSSTYYIGVGWARKTVDVNQYQQLAKQNAQADMAGDISVNISSNSVYSTLEVNYNFREDFTSTIKAEVQQELEGYELIDTWEDETSYWVYYRLSKAEHHRLKELKKANALTRSLDLYGKGVDALEAGNIRLALVHFIQALEPIKPYFSEPLQVEFRGKSIFLGNEIFGKLSSTLSSIEISPVNKEVEAKTGKGLTQSQLEFTISHKEKGKVYELPVIAVYSERPIRNNQKRTDSSGKVAFEVDVVKSTKTFETFTVSIDIEVITLEATTEPFIRRLVNRLSKPEGVLRINIQKPVMYIDANESNISAARVSNSLYESFRKKAIEAGYSVKESKENADFIVKIAAKTVKAGETGSYKNVTLKGSISVETDQGNQIYHKPLDDIKGTHFDYNQASDEAFKEARRRIEISIFREVDETIKRR